MDVLVKLMINRIEIKSFVICICIIFLIFYFVGIGVGLLVLLGFKVGGVFDFFRIGLMIEVGIFFGVLKIFNSGKIIRKNVK